MKRWLKPLLYAGVLAVFALIAWNVLGESPNSGQPAICTVCPEELGELCEAWREAHCGPDAALGALAAPIAAGGACYPGLHADCAAWERVLGCPYPGPNVTSAMVAEMEAASGPWVPAHGIPPGMQESYPSVWEWWKDARDLPAWRVIPAYYCRQGEPCGRGRTAWEAMGKVVKPCDGCGSQACWAWSGDHGASNEALRDLLNGYSGGRNEQSLAQWLQAECNRESGKRWIADAALKAAKRCSEAAELPPPPPPPTHEGPEEPVVVPAGEFVTVLCSGADWIRSVSPPDPEDDRERSVDEVATWWCQEVAGVPYAPWLRRCLWDAEPLAPRPAFLRQRLEEWDLSPKTLKALHDQWKPIVGALCPREEP